MSQSFGAWKKLEEVFVFGCLRKENRLKQGNLIFRFKYLKAFRSRTESFHVGNKFDASSFLKQPCRHFSFGVLLLTEFLGIFKLLFYWYCF